MDTPLLIIPTHCDLQTLKVTTDHQPTSPDPRRKPRYTFRAWLADETRPGSLVHVQGEVHHWCGRWMLNATAGHGQWIDEDIDPAAAAELARLLQCLGVL